MTGHNAKLIDAAVGTVEGDLVACDLASILHLMFVSITGKRYKCKNTLIGVNEIANGPPRATGCRPSTLDGIAQRERRWYY